MRFLDEVKDCIPESPEAEFSLDRTERLFGASFRTGMKATLQNPVYHGEGDVDTHTEMVLKELLKNPAFYRLPGMQRAELFLAAVLHDIGKVKTTQMENGVWVSPHHASTGSQMVRTLLWQDFGVCGTPEMLVFRETVCALVRYHMLPVRLMAQDDPERTVRRIASVGELAKDFSWELLLLLAEADVRGRIADDIGEGLTQVELARMTAAEAGCLSAPYPFQDRYTEYAWLSGRKVQPDQALYDDTWGEVILLSGLPGTGKDTWIARHAPDLPQVSLDEIRTSSGIRPTDGQGEVIQAAQAAARACLRKKQPFVWNATNLTRETRRKLTGLFERYGARVRIVYLETDAETRAARNAGRPHAVPEAAVSRMLQKTVPPAADEAQTVEWICV